MSGFNLKIESVAEQFLTQLRAEILKNKNNMGFNVPAYKDVVEFVGRQAYSMVMRTLVEEGLVVMQGTRYTLPGRIVTTNVFVVTGIPVPIIFANHADAKQYAQLFEGSKIETMVMAK